MRPDRRPDGGSEHLTATGAQAIVYTASGNQKQLITHGLLYAPTGRLEFGNATASAKQKILGGLVVARLVLQSSASAENFEIHVATSPVDYTVLLIATATKAAPQQSGQSSTTGRTRTSSTSGWRSVRGGSASSG